MEFKTLLFPRMVAVAQLVRASVCGTEGRGFESRQPPHLQPKMVLRIWGADLESKSPNGMRTRGWFVEPAVAGGTGIT